MGLPSDRAFEALRRDFAGDVVTPDSVSYDDARTVFNAMIQRRPAALAQCASPEDVAAALAFAQQHGLEIAIRGGGHSVAGKGVTEGGLVIDLRRMNCLLYTSPSPRDS